MAHASTGGTALPICVATSWIRGGVGSAAVGSAAAAAAGGSAAAMDPPEVRRGAGGLRTAWDEDPRARMPLHRVPPLLHAGGDSHRSPEDVLGEVPPGSAQPAGPAPTRGGPRGGARRRTRSAVRITGTQVFVYARDLRCIARTTACPRGNTLVGACPNAGRRVTPEETASIFCARPSPTSASRPRNPGHAHQRRPPAGAAKSSPYLPISRETRLPPKLESRARP